jgi:hypothetical protein
LRKAEKMAIIVTIRNEGFDVEAIAEEKGIEMDESNKKYDERKG